MARSRSAPLLTLLNAPMVAAYTAAGFWGDETIYHLAARHARTMPHAYAVRDRRRRLSYADLATAANRLATHLAADAANYAVALAVVGLALQWRARAALLKGGVMGLFGLWVAASTIHHALTGTVPHAEVMGGIAAARRLHTVRIF